MVTDPIADFLVRLQNASMARKERVSIPFSRMKQSIAAILAREGYVGEVEDKSKKDHTLTVTLTYTKGRPSIEGFKRISKPGRRMYLGVHDLHPVKRGHGLMVLSTPAGILTSKEAKAKSVGGEALFEIW